MFTGIIQNFGIVHRLEYKNAGARLEIACEIDATDLQIGDSIAINGTCLTLVELITTTSTRFLFDLGPETLEKTTLGKLRVSQKVHIEKALRFSDRLGGHLVQGHVDGIGILIAREYEGEALKMRFTCAADILGLCIHKGSICIDGVSLTLNQVDESGFEVCLIPHTLDKTCLGTYQIGHQVNLENDLIGKYVEKQLGLKRDSSQISWDLLKQSGFINESYAAT